MKEETGKKSCWSVWDFSRIFHGNFHLFNKSFISVCELFLLSLIAWMMTRFIEMNYFESSSAMKFFRSDSIFRLGKNNGNLFSKKIFWILLFGGDQIFFSKLQSFFNEKPRIVFGSLPFFLKIHTRFLRKRTFLMFSWFI